MAEELSVFTFNIWGLGCGLSADLGVRVKAIAAYLSTADYDIVLLQEVWMSNDYKTIREATRENYPYAHFFDQGIVGSGTCVLSKHVIQASTFHEFSLNGYPHAISHGDWFAGKGLGFCRILYKDMLLNVFVSHLHAEYCRVKDVYLAHRIMQSLESAQWIRLGACSADLTLYCGDMNTEPSDVPYSILRGIGGLEDSWLNAHKAEKGGETCATPFNSYTLDWEKTEFPTGKRIDYVLYSAGPGIKAEAVDCKLPLTKYVPATFSPSKQISYSDHEAVTATIKLQRTNSDVDLRQREMAFPEDTARLMEAAQIIDSASKGMVFHAAFYLGITLACLLLFSFSFNGFFLTESRLVDFLVFIGRLVFTVLGMYALAMGTLFNQKEKNALLSAKASLNLLVSDKKEKNV